MPSMTYRDESVDLSREQKAEIDNKMKSISTDIADILEKHTDLPFGICLVMTSHYRIDLHATACIPCFRDAIHMIILKEDLVHESETH